MLRAIEFKDKRFRTKEDYNLLSPLTENTIILCHNYKLMNSLSEEIINTVNGKAEYNDYDCDDEDIGSSKMWLSFYLQRVIDINGQRITLALEPAIIYKSNCIEDIWLFDCSGVDVNGEKTSLYQEFIYFAYSYIGSDHVWENEKDALYKTICAGKYGTYDGKWIDVRYLGTEGL